MSSLWRDSARASPSTPQPAQLDIAQVLLTVHPLDGGDGGAFTHRIVASGNDDAAGERSMWRLPAAS
jgi:hypothetical protein